MAKMKTRRTVKPHSRAHATAAPKRGFPAHLHTSPEEWRALKRTEWREVRQAMERFYHGSAYIPAQSAFHKMGPLMGQVTEAIEAPDWIAW
jgi:hypothetical protein